MGELGRAKAISELREQILEPMTIDPDGPLALGSRSALYQVKRGQDTQHTLDEAQVLIAWAERLEDWQNVAQLHMQTANEHISVGNTTQGEIHLNQSLMIAKKHRLKARSQILRSMCFFMIRTGDLLQAFNYAREATLEAEQRGEPYGIAKGLAMMARVKWQAGEIDLAEFYLNEAAFRHTRIGYRRGLAEVWNTRGELARARGDLSAAEHAYREAVERYESCGSVSAVFAKLNLGSTYVSAGKFAEAEIVLNEVDDFLQKTPRPVISAHQAAENHLQDSLPGLGMVESGLVQVKRESKTGLVDVDSRPPRGPQPWLASMADAGTSQPRSGTGPRPFEALGRSDEATESARSLVRWPYC